MARPEGKEGASLSLLPVGWQGKSAEATINKRLLKREAGPIRLAERASRCCKDGFPGGRNRGQEQSCRPHGVQRLPQPRAGCGQSKGTSGTPLNPTKAQDPRFCFFPFKSKARSL